MTSPIRISLLMLLLCLLNLKVAIAESGLDRLSYMVGDWKATRYFKDPRNKWVKADEINVTFEMSGNGKFITADIQQEGDQRYLILSWDQYQKKYRAAVMDYSSGLLDVYTGILQSSETLMLTNGKESYNIADGNRIFNRYVLSQNDAGFIIESYRSIVGEGAEWVQISKTEFSIKQ